MLLVGLPTVEERSNRAFTKPSFFHSLIIHEKTPVWGFSVQFLNWQPVHQKTAVVAPLQVHPLTICLCGGSLLLTTWLMSCNNRYRLNMLRVFGMRIKSDTRCSNPVESCWMRLV